MRRLYAYGPTRGFTQRVQAITPRQPRSADILDDLREISRLVGSLVIRMALVSAASPPTIN
jgi:hypothetical protein